ncbi:OLC1v1031313C1 [Oldenlandia corymbosa var. corymbosa]|uniref:OLC1v1031313C1 n=1 Tax=Oldenlandia corymbosa var. corymbosa TaxID=529605 RepID=A0AAV1CI34_OLDCO|nr:OLC1v1031313C1 [Oldenlandia corymbosa var. corymbosa]
MDSSCCITKSCNVAKGETALALSVPKDNAGFLKGSTGFGKGEHGLNTMKVELEEQKQIIYAYRAIQSSEFSGMPHGTAIVGYLFTDDLGDLGVVIGADSRISTGGVPDHDQDFGKLRVISSKWPLVYGGSGYVTSNDDLIASLENKENCSDENKMDFTAKDAARHLGGADRRGLGARLRLNDSILCRSLEMPSKLAAAAASTCHRYEIMFSAKLALKPLLIILGLLCFGGTSHAASCNQLDRDSLLTFSNNITSHSSRLDWNVSADCCSWEGVSCDIRSGRVISLKLPLRGLVGSISRSTANLSHLRELNLTGNSLTANLIHLCELNLSDNLLAGSFPDGFFVPLNQLQVIDLSYNRLCWICPASELHFPCFNSISGPLPEDVYKLLKLQELSVPRNRLNGSLSYKIPSLSNLRILSLYVNEIDWRNPSRNRKTLPPGTPAPSFSNNSLTNVVAALRSLPHCRAIRTEILAKSFNNEQLPGDENDNWLDSQGFQNLQVLGLGGCQFGGGIPHWLAKLSTLKPAAMVSSTHPSSHPSSHPSLLCRTKIAAEAFHRLLYLIAAPGKASLVISVLGDLKALRAGFNSLSGPLPQDIYKLSALQELSIPGNKLNGSLSNEIVNLKNLTIFAPYGNELAGIIPPDIRQLSNLKILQLHVNKFRGGLPPSLANCTKLTVMTLRENLLSGDLSNFNFYEFTHLPIIDLSNNHFNWDLPTNLFDCDDDDSFLDSQGFQNLEFLVLSGCQFSGRIPSWLGKLPKLKALGLSYNDLTGPIPTFFTSLPDHFYLDLSQNHISGEFPLELTKMPRWANQLASDQVDQTFLELLEFVKPDNISTLQYFQLSIPALFLGSNNLSGSILPEIGRLRSIYLLNLSHNQFSGGIHNTMSYLINLEELDLSDNHLTGEIPTSIENFQFLSFFSVANNNLQGPIPPGGQFVTFSNDSFEGNPGLYSRDLQRPSAGQPANKKPSASHMATRKISKDKIIFELRVISLKLPSRGLVGSISLYIANLSHLLEINLTGNSLMGTLPDDLFASLNQLQVIDLSNNRLSGQLLSTDKIPATIKSLDFSSNDLDGTIPLEFLEQAINLVSFNISDNFLYGNNFFEGFIPGFICGISRSIRVLDFSYNHFTGTIPRELQNCTKLETLRAGFNELSGPLPEDIYKLSALRELSFPGNKLNGSLILGGNEIVNLKNLSILALYGNELAGIIPPDIRQLSNLEIQGTIRTLILAENFYKEPLPGDDDDSFLDSQGFQNLEFLDLSGCQFGGRIPSWLGSNNLNGSIPPEIGRLRSIYLLNLSHNWFSRGIPNTMFYLINLEELDISDNHLTGEISTSIENLQFLGFFSVANNNLQGPIPPGATCHAVSCNLIDRDSLLSFSNNTMTRSSSHLEWNVSVDCCVWEGVTCDIRTGRVTGLKLPSRGLVGSISLYISNLSHLLELNLTGNSLTGTLPDGLFVSLNQLQVIDLSNNRLSGQLPSTDMIPATLTSLDFSSNDFEGTIPIEFLERAMNLVSFNINNNFFYGSVPWFMCSVSSSIRVLDFSYNHFSGSIPQEVGNCTRLEILRAGFNSLSGPLPQDIYKLSTMQELSFPGNKLNGSLGNEIANLNNLTILALYGNELSGAIPPDIGKLSNLVHLFLHTNKLNGVLPISLTNCTKLTELILRNNLLTGDISNFNFSKLIQLCMIDLGNNLFIGNLPPTLFSCKSLIAVRLAVNQLTGDIPPNIQDLYSLSFLSISNNSLTNFAGTIRILSNCKALSTLLLGKNFYNELLPDVYNDSLIDSRGFQNLQVLGLGNCHFSGPIPGWLAKLQKLKALDLSYNYLTGSIPSFFGSLPDLFFLDLSQNRLSGKFPVELTTMPRLASNQATNQAYQPFLELPVFIKIDNSTNQVNQLSSLPPAIYLRSNNLSGNIPMEIGKLKFIHVLDLSDNYFSGSIPNTISSLVNLEKLDLSKNHLSGANQKLPKIIQLPEKSPSMKSSSDSTLVSVFVLGSLFPHWRYGNTRSKDHSWKPFWRDQQRCVSVLSTRD